MKLIKFLKYPYPFYENSRQGFNICLAIGAFIGSFCYLFEPFGLNEVTGARRLGYGLVSLVVCLFYIVLVPIMFCEFFSTKSWKIYKEILWVGIITLSLATANYFYTGYAFQVGYSFNFESFLLVLLYTSIIAIIPAITIILYKRLFEFKKIVKEVEKLDSQLLIKNNLLIPSNEKITIHSSNRNDVLEIRLDNFVLLSSASNYVEIYYYHDAIIEKKLIRNNISKIDNQITKNKNLIRCHRSFIINLDYVKKIKGNLQGYQLYFDAIDFHVPVSRRITKTIKSKLLTKKASN